MLQGKELGGRVQSAALARAGAVSGEPPWVSYGQPALCRGIPSYTKRTWQTRQSCSDVFSKVNEMRLSCQGKESLWPGIKFEFSSEKENSGKRVSNTVSQTTSRYLKTFLMNSEVILTNVIL